MTDTTPATEAGREHLENDRRWHEEAGFVWGVVEDAATRASILAIEAEARSAALDEWGVWDKPAPSSPPSAPARGRRPVSVEHQPCPPRHLEPRTWALHAADRRHIETDTADDGAITRREWWWEADIPGCSVAPRPHPLWTEAPR